MNVLVFNCGTSSLKYKLLAMPAEKLLCGGEAQRVGPPTAEKARIIHKIGDRQQTFYVDMPDHPTAFEEVLKLLADPSLKPEAIGHRLVHGGTRFARQAIVHDGVLADLVAIQDLAPLHNPPATFLVRACQERAPHLPQVCVFDTAYHATIPECARTYALPRSLADKLGIRKYGFHGTSHQFVVSEAAKMLGKPLNTLNAVSCHLGSGGASLCAVVNGQSLDNTMGLTPLQGLVMSTRCGDLDPAVVLRLLEQNNGDGTAVENLLNKKSGVLGMSGMSADIRDVLARLSRKEDHQTRLELTAQVYLWRLRKYLGEYLALIGRADAILFTDTIGETLPQVRAAMCADMECFGVRLDPERNTAGAALPVDVAAEDSRVRLLVIATNEELAIVRVTYQALTEAGTAVRQGGVA